ncbi:MAG: hypothetical protein SGARI_001074 [Bacillariaceae sp.]
MKFATAAVFALSVVSVDAKKKVKDILTELNPKKDQGHRDLGYGGCGYGAPECSSEGLRDIDYILEDYCSGYEPVIDIYEDCGKPYGGKRGKPTRGKKGDECNCGSFLIDIPTPDLAGLGFLLDAAVTKTEEASSAGGAPFPADPFTDVVCYPVGGFGLVRPVGPIPAEQVYCHSPVFDSCDGETIGFYTVTFTLEGAFTLRRRMQEANVTEANVTEADEADTAEADTAEATLTPTPTPTPIGTSLSSIGTLTLFGDIGEPEATLPISSSTTFIEEDSYSGKRERKLGKGYGSDVLATGESFEISGGTPLPGFIGSGFNVGIQCFSSYAGVEGRKLDDGWDGGYGCYGGQLLSTFVVNLCLGEGSTCGLWDEAEYARTLLPACESPLPLPTPENEWAVKVPEPEE